MEPVGLDTQDLPAVEDTLRPSATATGDERAARCISWPQPWQSSPDPVHQHVAKIMSSFAPGLLIGGEAADFPTDKVDLERWCKGPTGHARRMHGHRHAGVRSVQQGPTLMLALDAHVHPDGLLTVGDLAPYGHAGEPAAGRRTWQDHAPGAVAKETFCIARRP